MTTTTLIVPGLNSSGSAHWQSWIETELPEAVRVIQSDWKRANLPEWSSRIRREIARRTGPVLIAAHSFGALAAVQAAEDYRERVKGVLLVAPADPDKFGVAGSLPEGPLGFPATLVASANDPWLSIDKALALALRWGADFVDLGPAGHINAESGFGPWPFGISLLRQLEDREVWTGRRGAGGPDPVPDVGLRLVTPQAAAAFAKWRERPVRTHRSRSPGSETTIADDVSGFVVSRRGA